MPSIPFRRLAAVALIGALTVACHDSTAPSGAAAGHVAVTGAVAYAFDAPATVSRIVQPSGTSYYISIWEGPDRSGIGFSYYGPTLRPGIYPVHEWSGEPERAFAGSYEVGSIAQSPFFEATGGTVTIERVSAGQLSGRFDVEMRQSSPAASATLHATGRFSAPVEAEPYCPTCLENVRPPAVGAIAR